MHATNFKEFLKQEKLKSDRTLQTFWDKHIESLSPFQEPVFIQLVTACKDLMLRGGKRARPLLVRLAYELAVGKIDNQIELASLYPEFIHTFFLVHDDIADQDMLRYGGPTLEVQFRQWFESTYGDTSSDHVGKTMAMLAGDHLRTMADHLLSQTSFEATRQQACVSYMAEVITSTLAGWTIQYNLNFELINLSQENRFMKGLELVTSKYSFEAPLMIGLFLSGKHHLYSQPLKEYAHHTGVAFQIQDDILGVFGNTAQTGKPVGNDLREGKKTLLVLKAYEQAGTKDRQFIEEHLGKKISEFQIQKFQEIIKQTDSLKYSVELAQNHIDHAKKSLDTIISTRTEPLTRLKQLADFVGNREY